MMTKKALKSATKLALFVALLILAVSLFGLISACGKKDEGEAITLDVTEKAIYVADRFQIGATTRDEDADITWTSSNDKVATVKRGAVTGIAVGEATITASLDSGESATCVVTVSDRTVTISEHSKEVNYEELGEDKTITLSATCSSGEAVSWSSSDTSVATVNNNGVVKFSQPKAQTAEVTITAYKGAASDDCVITVTSPSIPEDYYELMKETNANVVASPGIWYYHADGAMGTNYRFAENPAYGEGKLTADLDIFPSLADGKYFRFRYQPDFEEGTKYTIKFTVTLNVDAKLGFGTNATNGGVQSQTVQADTAKNMVYIGTVNTAEPFHININQLNSEIGAEDHVTFLITNIVVKEYEAGDENLIEEELPPIVELPDEYDLVRGDTATTCDNPGKWYYMIDPVNAGAVDYTEAKYNRGVVTLALKDTLTGQYHQLRIRPAYVAGTKVTATFTVSLSAPGEIYYALNNVGESNRAKLVFGDGEKEVGTEVEVTYDFTVSGSVPFVIWIKPVEGTAVTMTVKDVSFEERLPATYTVTFESNEGTEIDPEDVTEGNSITLTEPERAGYVFDGWYEDDEFETAVELVEGKYTPTGSLTLYAKWLEIYTVTYDSKEGSEVDPQSVTEGETIQSAPAAPEKDGYVFGGWYEDEDYSGEAVVFPYTPSASVTLYAKWLDIYTVTYDAKDGTPVPAQQKVTEGESIQSAPAAPEKDDHQFGGWYEDEDCSGEAVVFPYTPSKSVTLYANWIENTVPTYTVTYNTNGGDTIQPQTVIAGEGASVTLTTPVRAGYQFDGWYEDDKFETAVELVEGKYPLSESVILHAKWLEIYTVSFDTNGGGEMQSQSVIEGSDEKVTKPEDPVKEDYVFGGWYEDDEFETAVEWVEGEYAPTASVTFYAKWLEIYTVSYKLNTNGRVTIADEQVTAIESETVTEGDSITLAEPTRHGFTFDGWYEDEDLETAVELAEGKYAPSATVTLYAKWTETDYTIESVSGKDDSTYAVRNRGVWYYELNGTQSVATVNTANYEDGEITFDVTGAVNTASGNNALRLVYLPDLPFGTKYTLTFKVTVSVAGKYKSCANNESGSMGSTDIAANTEKTITYTGVVGYVKDGANVIAAYNFNFYNTTDASAVTITIKDVVAEKYQIPAPPASYEVVEGLNSAVKANPLKWYYYVGDGHVETHFTPAPKFEDGVLTVNCTAMEKAAYQFRFMPCDTTDKKTYTVTFTVKVVSDDYDVMSVFSTNGTDVDKTTGENGEITVTCTYAHQSDVNPFYIQFQPSAKVEQAVSITISDISFTEVA